MKNFMIGCTFFTLTFSGIALAAPTQHFDDKGRLIMQKNEDGTISTYSYDKKGKRTVNDSSRGQAVHINDTGNSKVIQKPAKKQ